MMRIESAKNHSAALGPEDSPGPIIVIEKQFLGDTNA